VGSGGVACGVEDFVIRLPETGPLGLNPTILESESSQDQAATRSSIRASP